MNKYKIVLLLLVFGFISSLYAQAEAAARTSVADINQAEEQEQEDNLSTDEVQTQPQSQTKNVSNNTKTRPKIKYQAKQPQETDYVFKNGFSVNYIMGIADFEESDSKVSQGLKLGNRWYFYNNQVFGFGLMANWLDYNVEWINVNGRNDFSMLLSYLELGPVFTFAIDKSLGIDVYYTYKPGFVVNDSFGIGYFHGVGAAFRWKKINVGVEYVFGSLPDIDSSLDIKINRLRLLFGGKF